MRVSDVIKALQDEDPNSEVMIQWFTKEHVESNTSATYADEHWNLAVRLFDKWDVGMDDFSVPTCLSEARERLAAAE
jgi:hypothetical protein